MHFRGGVAAEEAGQSAKAGGIRAILVSPLFHLQVLLLLAIFLGGGGVAYGFRNLAIQLAALLVLALNPASVSRFVKSGPRVLACLVGFTLLLPLAQLIPLPPHVWQTMPGRDLVVRAHAIAGFGDDLYFPLSLDRARTLVAFVGLIAPAAIVLVGSSLSRPQLAVLAWTVLAACSAAFLWGIVQLQSGNTFGLMYPVMANPEILYATFANRNSTGLMMVLAALLAVPLACRPRSTGMVVAATIGVFMVLAVILTQSRSSLVLLVLPISFAALQLLVLWFRNRRATDGGRARASVSDQRWIAGAGFIGFCIVVAALAWSATHGGRVAEGLQRFETIAESDRPEMWEDTTFAIGRFWPVGSGMGTFDEVFQVDESLEYISPRRAGRAHNDWLEFTLEAGIAGSVLLALWTAWWGITLVGRVLRWDAQAIAGGLGLLAIALQSALDYPLRNQTLWCLCALCVILLAQRRKGEA